MSGTKLLLVPLVTTALHICFLPPPSPPKQDERIETKDNQKFQVVYYTYVKCLFWFVALLEGYAIIQNRELTNGYEVVFSLRLTPASIIGALMITLGALIRNACYNAMGHLFTIEMSIRNKHKLVQDGPYSIVRHPAYTGTITALTGCALWYLTPGAYLYESRSWLNILIAFLIVQTFFMSFAILIPRSAQEDELLREHFKSEWDEWASRVQYKFIPYIY